MASIVAPEVSQLGSASTSSTTTSAATGPTCVSRSLPVATWDTLGRWAIVSPVAINRTRLLTRSPTRSVLRPRPPGAFSLQTHVPLQPFEAIQQRLELLADQRCDGCRRGGRRALVPVVHEPGQRRRRRAADRPQLRA